MTKTLAPLMVGFTCLSWFVTGLVFWWASQQAVSQQSQRLMAIAYRYGRLAEEMALSTGKGQGQILTIIEDMGVDLTLQPATEELLIAKLSGGRSQCLFFRSRLTSNCDSSHTQTLLASEPTRKALGHQVGTLIYRTPEATWLSVYRPVRFFNWGIVVQIKLAEIQLPFLKLALLLNLLLLAINILIWLSYNYLRQNKQWANYSLNWEPLSSPESQFQTLMQSLGGIIYSYGVAEDFFEWQGNYLHILGYSQLKQNRHLHQWLDLVYSEDRQRVKSKFDLTLSQGTPLDLEYRVRHQKGHYLWVHQKGVFYKTANKSLLLIGIILDISARKEEQKIYSEVEEKYQKMLETSAEGIWIINDVGMTTFVNKTMATMLGYECQEMLDKTIFDLTDEEGKALAQESLKRRRQGINETHEFKFIHKNGQPVWTLISTNPLQDKNGNFVGALGMLTDISNQKKLELELKNAIKEVHELNKDLLLINELNELLQSCVTLQEAYQILPSLIAPLFANYSGGIFKVTESEEMVEMILSWGKTYNQSFFSPQDCWSLRRGVTYQPETGSQPLFCHHVLADAHLRDSICIPMSVAGKQWGFLFLGTAISEKLGHNKQEIAHILCRSITLELANLELKAALEEDNIRDPLTGLYNRRYWTEALRKQVFFALKNNQSLGLIMMDLDYFKNFNDTFGHQAGDRLLEAIGKLLKSEFRSSDTPCRYGGEEFLIILPGATLTETKARAQTLLNLVSELQIHYHGDRLGNLTASFGVSALPEHGLNAENLVQSADQALYQAKSQGRNRVCIP